MPQLVRLEPEVSVVVDTYRPEWRERTIVFRHRSGRVYALDAWQYGTLWLHATWDDPAAKPFTITHYPSKLSVAKFAEVDAAVEKAEWLWGKCPSTWARDEIDPVALPVDMVQWCRENKR